MLRLVSQWRAERREVPQCKGTCSVLEGLGRFGALLEVGCGARSGGNPGRCYAQVCVIGVYKMFIIRGFFIEMEELRGKG